MTESTPRRLHYPGDIRNSDIKERLLGPNQFGEYFIAESLEYDPVLDRTTAHLRFARSEDMTPDKKVWR